MNDTGRMESEETRMAEGDTDQYLTFILADEEYGVDIRKVQEVRGWEAVNQMPGAPPFIKGVINLRGAIVPIIDLRERFGQHSIEYTAKTVVIVMKVSGGEHTSTMGIVVDAVSDVYDIGGMDMRPPPDFCALIHAEFIRGLATINDKMITLIDSDRLLRLDELNDLGSLAGMRPPSGNGDAAELAAH